MTEHRRSRVSGVRQRGEGKFEAVAVTYNVVDDYGTVWLPGCFRQSLSRRLPPVVWGHDWQEPIGRVVSFSDTRQALTIRAQLDDFESVPRARQAWEQLRAGTVSDFSVGFTRQEWVEPSEPEFERLEAAMRGLRRKATVTEPREFMRTAQLDEVSVVLVGAVPDAQLVGVRSRRPPLRAQTADELLREADELLGEVSYRHGLVLDRRSRTSPAPTGRGSVDDAVALGKRVAAGELSHAEARRLLGR